MTLRDTRGDPPVRLGAAAAVVGRGLVAGLVGTAAMTASRAAEARLRGRPPSPTQVRAAGRVLGVAPVDEAGERRFNQIVHWAYGTGWGAVRGIFAAVGVPAASADAAHLAAVWGAEQVVMPATGAGSPVIHGPPPDIAADLAHHVVYAVATGQAFRWLERR